MLKPSCGIVNIGRQSAMDYEALCEKLTKKEIAGAILDVFSPEPIDNKSNLWNTPNLIITPHVSSDDNGNYVKMTLDLFVKNLKLLAKFRQRIGKIYASFVVHEKSFSYHSSGFVNFVYSTK